MPPQNGGDLQSEIYVVIFCWAIPILTLLQFRITERRYLMKRVFLGMMCAFLVLSLSFVAGAVDDDSLVLYLSFDKLNGDVVPDLSGTGNDGTVTGDADWVQDGRAGAGMLFKEIELDGVVIVKGSESLAIAESLTVEMWVYPNSVGDYRNVLGQIDPLAYFMSIHQAKPSVWFAASGEGGKTWLSTENEIPLEEWSHIAAVRDFDAGEMRLYINGQLDVVHVMEGELDVNPVADIWIGNRLDGGWPYGGMLDEFVMYNRALSDEEVQQDMNGVLSAVSKLEKLSTTWGSIKE